LIDNRRLLSKKQVTALLMEMQHSPSKFEQNFKILQLHTQLKKFRTLIKNNRLKFLTLITHNNLTSLINKKKITKIKRYKSLIEENKISDSLIIHETKFKNLLKKYKINLVNENLRNNLLRKLIRNFYFRFKYVSAALNSRKGEGREKY